MAKSKKEKTEVKDIVSEALAVKHRPRKFKDLVGQDHITTPLKGAIKLRKVPAAFLIEGQTGGGKTTLARMINTYLNCETGKACGKCDSCKLDPRNHPDLVNINAGVNGKVEEIRKLVKGSRVAPYFNKRIILIDEAHKLTGASAEALLIPLEEPSRDTIWILSTTNPEKLNSTLLNRCMHLTVKPLSMEHIVDRLTYVAKAEGLDMSSEEGQASLRLIADFANGSMRHAIAMLESVIYAAAGGAEVSNKEVLSAFIQTSDVDLDKAAVSLVGAVLNRDLKNAIKFIRKANNARGLLSKSRWLIDYCIGEKTKTAKFKPYSGRLFEKLVADKGIKVNLFDLLLLQMTLVEAEAQMNTLPVDESVLLQTAVAKFVFDNLDEEEENE